jgi:alpha-1,2-mannosyltransferase
MLTEGIVNILKYNLAGGASALYGTEGPEFYIKNILLNFNLAFLLALALPLVAFLTRRHMVWPGRLAVVYAPLPVWLVAMSAAAHKVP